MCLVNSSCSNMTETLNITFCLIAVCRVCFGGVENKSFGSKDTLASNSYKLVDVLVVRSTSDNNISCWGKHYTWLQLE